MHLFALFIDALPHFIHGLMAAPLRFRRLKLKNDCKKDAERIATLHHASWQKAYANIFPPDYIGEPLRAKMAAQWQSRLSPLDEQNWLVVVAEDVNNPCDDIPGTWQPRFGH